MADLITEILGYLAIAALLGLLIGFVIWGMGRRAALARARAEGMRSARTSMDGNEPLRAQLDAALAERGELRIELEHLRLNQRGPSLRAVADPVPLNRAPVEPNSATVHEASPEALPVEVPEEVSGEAPALDGADVAMAVVVPETAPASLLDAAPSDPDDLKRIKGVGPKMERILNGKGIYLFEQIANFSDDEVAWVNDAIDAFPGRIVRDRWVDQARDLYREKYGEALDS
ncbi:MAG: hypothetical protein AAGK00_00125 [Pseudomonadota bacterium]